MLEKIIIKDQVQNDSDEQKNFLDLLICKKLLKMYYL